MVPLSDGTICPRSSDPLCIVSSYINWVTTSWTHSSSEYDAKVLSEIGNLTCLRQIDSSSTNETTKKTDCLHTCFSATIYYNCFIDDEH